MYYKTIIITGTSKGLGASIAKEACKRNYMYYGLSRFSDIDVGKYDDVKTYFAGLYFYLTESKSDCPVALINNAGICKVGNILEMSCEDWQEQINVNLNGVFYCCKEYIKLCKKFNCQGKIINIASTAGTGARPGRTCYSATKSAVINFSFSLAEELKDYGIKVYCIAPGAFDSDLRREICPDDNFETMIKKEEISKFIMNIVDNGEFLDNQLIFIKR
jgi:3-oxoacyl-[acyl-carrier protein] reductase